MAVNPFVLQQYADAYNQNLGAWQRQGKAYNTAVNQYNAAVNTFNTQTQPQVQAAMNAYKGEISHLQSDIDQYNNNLWASNRDYWNNWINEVRGYHYGQANAYNRQASALERTMPIAPSAAQGLFNENLYLTNNPDVAAAVRAGQFKSGYEHYLSSGRNENRNAAVGGKANEKALQEAAAWQVKAEQANKSYLDALQTARFIGSNAEALANTGTAALNSALATASATPTGFNETAYLQQNPDVAAAVAQGQFPSGLAHYNAYGRNEGRAVQGIFDEAAYLRQNPDVANAVAQGGFSSGLSHYLQFGKNEGRAMSGLPSSAVNGIENAIISAHQTYLGGTPASGTVNNWTTQILRGDISVGQAVDAIRNSPDAQAYLASPSDSTQRTNLANERQAAYEAIINQRPDLAKFKEEKPTFTAEQERAMSGRLTPGQRMLAEQGGLISNERVSAASERQSPSFISGILAQARK